MDDMTASEHWKLSKVINSMRIVVDMQSGQSGSRHGGIGRYSLDLLKAMISAAPSDEFIILLNGQYNVGENYIRSELRSIVSPNDIVTFAAPKGSATINDSVVMTKSAEILRENFICNLNPDVVLVTSVIESLNDDIVTSIGLLEKSPPTAAILYDLIPMRQRKMYLQSRVARSHYFQKVNHLRNADALLAISQYSAEEMLEFFPDYMGCIENISGGIAPQFKAQFEPQKVAKIRDKYGLKKRFLLYTASFDERKNQKGLIEAFAKLPWAVRYEHQLAFAGGAASEIYESHIEHGLKLGLNRDDIRFLGRVSDEDLVTLYNGCDAFVFPPKWEGMGMPPLEAMACGVPVIGSNTTSVPEVIGWDEATFDPFDISSISEKLRLVMVDDAFRAENIRRGREHVKKFNWKFSAEKALTVLRSIAKPAQSTPPVFHSSLQALKQTVHTEELLDAQMLDVARCVASNDQYFSKSDAPKSPRVGWITSWGARCGIANYSEMLLDSAPDNIVVLASYKSNGIERKEARDVIRCWDEGKHDSLIDLTTDIDRQSLDAIHIQFNYGFFDFDALNSLIYRCIWKGVSVFITLHSTIDQSAEEKFRLKHIRLALKLCSAIFVHSFDDVERLNRLGINSNVRLLPFANPALAVSGQAAEERSFELITTYGFALPGKGLFEIVEALSLMRQNGRDVRLQMLNAAYADSDGLSDSIIRGVKEKISHLGLSDYVDLRTDYMENEDSLRLMSKSDLVVYPYTKTGESGSSAVRMGLLAQKPILVTPLEIFADVDAAVFKMPGTSPQDIAQSAVKLLDSIKNKDPMIAEKIEEIQRLNRVRSDSGVATYINDLINFRTGLNTWVSVFSPQESDFSLGLGVLENGAIVGTQPGTLCYGPYISLEPGLYRIVLRGELATKQGDASVSITAAGGTVNMGRASLFDLGQDVIGDYIFEVTSPVSGVEFVVSLRDKAEITLAGYEVLKFMQTN
ncbi:glycosyltransferase involved in cell wall biosynthesis [Agrobacterium vitis]|nr:glycosyltransferase involved in cell wall biosynthesis [Agrobacterium vitis]MBE1436562.1 glycosyltransferase involved in cell wall biosynthesis [Agrobacterium vitis]